MSQRQFKSDDSSVFVERFGNGSDGSYAPSTGTDAPIDSACTGTIDTTSLSATNASFAAGQLIVIHQTQGTGAGQWELNKIDSYVAGTITTSYSLIFGYATGAQVLVMPQYSSGLIDTGQTITLKAWDGTVGGIYAKFCSGTFTIAGSTAGAGANNVRGNSTQPSGGGFRGGISIDGTNSFGGQGESATGTGSQSSSANGAGGGGGGGNASYNAGGGGGNGAVGIAATGSGSTNGAAGGTDGGVNLVDMVFGAGGGGATGTAGIGGGISGGNGGGIVILISKNLTITGGISVNGGGLYQDRINGGGGAGGSILLKGQTLVLGTNLTTAIGGVLVGSPEDPGDGGVGRIHADYSTSISGTTNPTIDTTIDSIYVDPPTVENLNQVNFGGFVEF